MCLYWANDMQLTALLPHRADFLYGGSLWIYLVLLHVTRTDRKPQVIWQLICIMVHNIKEDIGDSYCL